MFLMLSAVALFCAYSMLCDVTSFFMSFDILTNIGYYWFLKLDYDYTTYLILTMLLMCFCYVWNYTGHYFSESEEGQELNKIILGFVCVMASLVSTGDLLTTLMLWEYLGVVSFFLMLFYSSYLSLRSSMITLVSSRFGDVCLFLLVSMGGFLLNNPMVGLLCVGLVVFTKSATFPFMSWLLEAMRAPTPVSSLVHSSTLVAAGVWFSMRYDFDILVKNFVGFSVLLMSTMLMTGLCCFYFLDLKKMVALSTCKKMAWCMLYLLFGDVTLSLFQLVSHGVSKCMLFMLVGDVMSGSFGSQASNGVYATALYKNWNVFGLFCVVLGLSGTPYIGVFFTKHFLLSQFMNMFNMLLSLMVLCCVFLSYFYSFRLCSILLNAKVSNPLGVEFMFKTSKMTYFSLCMSFFMTLCLDEVCYLGATFSIMLMLFQLISCVTAITLYNSTALTGWSSSLFGCDKMVETMYSLFYKCTRFVFAFITRWDKMVMAKFNKMGISYKSLFFSTYFLKMMMASTFLFIMCLYMVY